MKPKEKKMILILVSITIIVTIIFFTTRGKKEEDNIQISVNRVVEEFVQVLDNETKLNISTKLNEPKEVNGFRFENIQFTEKNGQTVFLANVANNTGKPTDITLVDLILLDKQGQEIVKVSGMISPLDVGEKTQFNTSMSLDYANAYDVQIVMK